MYDNVTIIIAQNSGGGKLWHDKSGDQTSFANILPCQIPDSLK